MMAEDIKKQTQETPEPENDSQNHTKMKDETIEVNVESDDKSEEMGVEEIPGNDTLTPEATTVEADETQPESEQPARDESELKLASEYLEQLQRLQAEFLNYKKRVERERKELSKFIKAELIRKLLPIIDDFERFIQNHQDSEIMDGFTLIHDKLMNTLKQEGLETIAATGTAFDPNYHDALYIEEVSEEEDDGKVLEEWEKGFFFQGSLLRPSKVKVGKKSNQAD